MPTKPPAIKPLANTKKHSNESKNAALILGQGSPPSLPLPEYWPFFWAPSLFTLIQ
jgi:hypothetical protein